MSSSIFLSWLAVPSIHHVQASCRRCCISSGRRTRTTGIHGNTFSDTVNRRNIHTSRLCHAPPSASTSSQTSKHNAPPPAAHHPPAHAHATPKDEPTSPHHAAIHPLHSTKGVHITQSFITKNGKMKVDLTKRSLVGVHQSRGERPYQEDSFAVRSLDLLRSEVEKTLGDEWQAVSKSITSTTAPSVASGTTEENTQEQGRAEQSTQQQPKPEEEPEQTLYCAVFDGHNGSAVSQFLSKHLHERLLTVAQNEANTIVSQYRSLGGYMRRYKGGLLSDIVEPPAPRRGMRVARGLKEEEERKEREKQKVEAEAAAQMESQESSSQAGFENPPVGESAKKRAEKPKKEYPPWSLLQRLEAAFLKTDLEIIETEQEAGSTATVALLHSLDDPRVPFFAADKLHLVLAHCGDTRAVLCTVPDGTAVRLTETHHPEARTETDRLMRIRTGAVTDSFGESRWAGTLANTRAFGDAHYKALGVFSEPQLVSTTISGASHSFLILLSDGVTEKLSDQEICDLARNFPDPSKAAKNIISFAESVGAQDNLTAVIVPLAGWGKVDAPDATKTRREFRLGNYEGRSSRQNRM